MPVGTTEEQVVRLPATAEAVPPERPGAHLDTRAEVVAVRLALRVAHRDTPAEVALAQRVAHRDTPAEVLLPARLAANRGTRAEVVLAAAGASGHAGGGGVAGSAGGGWGIRAAVALAHRDTAAEVALPARLAANRGMRAGLALDSIPAVADR